MLKIECCGLTSTETKHLIEKNFPGEVEAYSDADMIAARKVKSGEMDFYLGSCQTGGGGSLAIAIPVLGYANTIVVSRQGKCPDAKTIRNLVYSNNKKAFGYVNTHTDKVVVPLVRALVDKAEGRPE